MNSHPTHTVAIERDSRTRANIALGLVCYSIFSVFTAIWPSFETISSLNYGNAELKRLRSEVQENLKRLAKGDTPELTWRRYKIEKDDNFFTIMARTMLNHDTLSSVNRLASLWDVQKGDVWLVPNARGIAVEGAPQKLAQKYDANIEEIVPVPNTETYYFVPGARFKPDERDYFNLRIFIRPVKGRVSSNYGYRKDPFSQKARFHEGIDLAVPIGTNVKASASGKVIWVGHKSGYGKTIVLHHRNGYKTLYGHLKSYKVKKGDRVKQGDSIAHSGNTGRSTGPHLHFEVRRDGKPTRPRFARHK